MTAKGISDGLQEQFGEIIPWNFQCTVFNSPDEFALVGDDMGWGRFEKNITVLFFHNNITLIIYGHIMYELHN